MKILPFAIAALAFARFASALDSTVVFNEIQYNPAPGQAEFIELRNLHGVDVSVAGWKIDGGVDFTFPAGTVVPGGGYVLIGDVPGAIGAFSGQLDNGGETLRLKNLNGRVMDELTYDDENGWPIGADGAGASLTRRAAKAATGPGAWTASAQIGGTPGAKNFAESTDPAVVTTLVPLNSSWKYRDDNVAQGAGWNGLGFDDSAWASGGALLYAGNPNITGAGEGLHGYWPLAETTGTTAPNAVAGGTAGTLFNGASWVADATRGRVLQLDGVDGYVDAGTIPQITTSNNLTWSFWAYSSQIGGNVVVGNRYSTSGVDWVPREFIKFTSDLLQYDHNLVEVINYTDFPLSTWVHHALVKQGATFTYYRNGIGGGALTISVGQNNAQPFYFGGDRVNENWAGKLDDVAVWTKALPASSITGLANGTLTPLTAPTGSSGGTLTTAVAQGPTTHYFRKAFTFSGARDRTTVTLQHVVNDGAVFYLNGAEVLRVNLPGGAITHATPALNEVGGAAFSTAVPIPTDALVSGTNVLAVEVHQHTANPDMVFGATLVASELPLLATPSPLIFSEVAGAADANFFLELRNTSASAVNLNGWTVATTDGQSAAIAPQSLAAGEYLALNAATLGFTPANGAKLMLLAPGGTELRDAREVTSRLSGAQADGQWGFPSEASPGSANVFALNTEIVINEIFYKAPLPTPPALPSGEQWIELYNRSAHAVDIGGWKFSEGVSFTIPIGTVIPTGGYVVVAWNPATFATLHPGVTAFGPFSGTLSGRGETITLLDANGNVANQVTYADGGRWSQWADGGGSSLGVIDPHGDNSKGEAWDASDESSRSTWQNVTVGPAAALVNPGNNPTNWNEFLFGLLDAGEMLIDDISVKHSATPAAELIQNGQFTAGNPNTWRIIGTHRGTVVPDPTAPGNNVLKVTASAETEHMHNHAGTTLKNGGAFHTILSTGTYTITFRAKWLRGSNLLHSRLYVNRLPLKTVLNRPTTGGTPGAPNTRFAANLGPTFDALAHAPVVPPVSQAATVSVKVEDPDGVASVQLFTSINGAAFTSSAMTGSGGVFTGTIPGQGAGALVQFYIRATDTPGAVSFFPAGGATSRAMIQWNDGRAQLTLASGARPHNLRVIMPGADANDLYKHENLMSNASVPCTVIYDEKDVYYRAGVALKSSEHGRFNIGRVGYNIEFPADNLFLGVHASVSIDRSGGVVTGQKEILVKTLSILAGGIHAPQDDIIRLIPARATGSGFQFDGSGMLGAAILSKTRLKSDYVGSQWDNGGDGMMFKYERIYVLTQTINPVTRVIDGGIVPENPKIPQDSTSPPGVAVANLGASPELYRWHWLVEGGREFDDYTGVLNVTNAIGQPAGATFNNLVSQYIDVDEWTRAHVPAILFGVVDNYLAAGGAGSQHNVLVYFPPGKKAVLFPWDMDFLDQSNPTAATLATGGDIAKFIANPAWKRLYYGHLLDVLNKSFNSATMTTWATHYQRFGTDEMVSSVAGYLTPRAQYARDFVLGTNGQTAPIPFVVFARTSASPATVATPFATVTGNGWINLAEIRLQGSPEPLAITWTGQSTWSVQLPIRAGTNLYTLVPYDKYGVQLGNTATGGTPVTATVTITGSGGIFPAGPGNLAVTELNYNPAGATDATEFIELRNVTAATLDLSGCHFDEELGQGIAYTFANGVQLAPGARILVVRDTAAFNALYGPGLPVAAGVFTGALDNSGESLVLYSAGGQEIFRFSYSDTIASTDGAGKTLVRVLSSTNPNVLSYVWRESTADNGNPGTSDTVLFTGTPLLDGDGDGYLALVEYACGTSDTNPASMPAPPQFTFYVNGTVSITYPTVPNADDVICTVETTTTPGANWVPLTGPVPAGATRFFRLNVTLR